MTESANVSADVAAPIHPVTNVPPESLLQAYEQVRERIARVSEDNMQHVTLEIPNTVTQVLVALKSVRGFRTDILKLVPTFEMTDIDQLENYAYALAHLHARWVFATNPPDILPERIQRATVLRDILVSQVSTLAKLGLVDGSVLNDLKGPVGHKNLAIDVIGMSGVLRESWPNITGKVSVTLEQLNEADRLGKGIFDALTLREQAAGEQSELNRERMRATKLVMETYNHARRAVGFLRWNEGDADRYVPSLYAGRGGPKRKGDAPAEQADPSATPVTSPTLPAQPSLPVGHPNSDPFTA